MLPPVFKFRTNYGDGVVFKARVFEGVVTVRWTWDDSTECRYYSTRTVEQHIASGVWKIIKEEDNGISKMV